MMLLAVGNATAAAVLAARNADAEILGVRDHNDSTEAKIGATRLGPLPGRLAVQHLSQIPMHAVLFTSAICQHLDLQLRQTETLPGPRTTPNFRNESSTISCLTWGHCSTRFHTA